MRSKSKRILLHLLQTFSGVSLLCFLYAVMVWLSVIPFNASASIIDCKLRYLPIFLTSSQFIILMIPFFTAPNLRFLFNCPLFCLFNDLALSMSSVLFGRCLVHHSLRRQYIIAAVCYPLSGYFLTWIFP